MKWNIAVILAATMIATSLMRLEGKQKEATPLQAP